MGEDEKDGVQSGAPASPESVSDEPAGADGRTDPQEPEVAVSDAVEQLTPEQAKIRELEAESATAKSQLQEAQARLRTVSKAYTDLQAEMKAFRERQEARAKLDGEMQAFSLAKTFFDPVMNLKRSVATAIDAESTNAGLLDGLKMVQHQFMEAMTKLGLEEVPGEGSVFDPNLHEALAVTPVLDASQDGRVLTVHTAGYSVRGRVLQAAQVVVGKYQEADGEADA
ncbi:MAG: nucleotide exchange factor GrpE [Myxococcales bacterium]|nr:nucleotide exchange factor GrpE [Myxococcales bacterium]